MAIIIINRHNTVKKIPFNFLLELEWYMTCKNIGCRASFKWRMQLSRHLKNCPHEKWTKEYCIQNGQYVCGKCSKAIKHQSNIKRNLQKCKNKVDKSLYKCPLYPGTERFKCWLEKTWSNMHHRHQKPVQTTMHLSERSNIFKIMKLYVRATMKEK